MPESLPDPEMANELRNNHPFLCDLVKEIIHCKLSWGCVQALVFTNKTEENSLTTDIYLLLFSYSLGFFFLSSYTEVLL